MLSTFYFRTVINTLDEKCVVNIIWCKPGFKRLHIMWFSLSLLSISTVFTLFSSTAEPTLTRRLAGVHCGATWPRLLVTSASAVRVHSAHRDRCSAPRRGRCREGRTACSASASSGSPWSLPVCPSWACPQSWRSLQDTDEIVSGLYKHLLTLRLKLNTMRTYITSLFNLIYLLN